MPFTKGKSGNPKGKKPGTKSRSAEEVRSFLLEFISDNLTTIQRQYDELEGKDKLLYLDRLFKHTIPPMITNLNQLNEDDLQILIDRLKKQDNDKTDEN